MKTLIELLNGIRILDTTGDLKRRVTQIVFDSRKVEKGTAFVAVRGTQLDGHHFINRAIESGANSIICEKAPSEQVVNVTYIVVEDCSSVLGVMASNFYDNPSRQLKLIGVTGTNGKTTTVTMLFDLLTGLGYKSGLISTVENRIAQKVLPSTHTTPDPIALNALMSEMVAQRCEYAFMEVSSHAIHQNRIAGLLFAGAVFSNITHDHLDYHKTFDEYIKAKKKFFDELPKSSFAIINADDKNGNVMVQNTKATIHRYALRKFTEFKAKILENTITGLHLLLDGHDYYGRLIGEFNAYNTLAVYAVAVLLGMDKLETLTVLSGLKGAEGRFDSTYSPERDITGIVDYAHTPDALEKILSTIAELRKPGQRIICLTGCGGDRDPMKRKIMGAVGAKWSDVLILTSDNPRSEDPQAIIEQMKEGISSELMEKVLEIPNRAQAIKTAIKTARPGDIILAAGKGHEKYQEIKGIKFPFDDKEELLKGLKIS